jgi:hypothetical protein
MDDKVKITRYRGDTFTLGISVVDSDGESVSQEGVDVRFTIDCDPAVTEESEDVTVEIEDNSITITVPYGLMEVAVGTYPFDVETTTPGGVRQTLVLGDLEIREDVTQ